MAAAAEGSRAIVVEPPNGWAESLVREKVIEALINDHQSLRHSRKIAGCTTEGATEMWEMRIGGESPCALAVVIPPNFQECLSIGSSRSRWSEVLHICFHKKRRPVMRLLGGKVSISCKVSLARVPSLVHQIVVDLGINWRDQRRAQQYMLAGTGRKK